MEKDAIREPNIFFSKKKLITDSEVFKNPHLLIIALFYHFKSTNRHINYQFNECSRISTAAFFALSVLYSIAKRKQIFIF